MCSAMRVWNPINTSSLVVSLLTKSGGRSRASVVLGTILAILSLSFNRVNSSAKGTL